jgi:hypothetical protein
MAKASAIEDNGPFDPRITSIPFLQKNGNSFDNSKKLTRGFIVMEKPINGVRYRCNFLYNPSEIDISHGIDTGVLADQNSQLKNDVTAGQFILPLQQTLSFSLQFDRTYELWDPSKLFGDARTWVPQFGVAYDVLSLYKITGVATPMNVTGDNATDVQGAVDNFKKGSFSNSPAGPMIYTPVFVVIGSSLSYYGVIQQLDVRYTHWTQQMIPSRCVVQVSVTLLPAPQGGNKYAPIIGPRVPNAGDPKSQSEQLGKSGKAGR